MNPRDDVSVWPRAVAIGLSLLLAAHPLAQEAVPSGPEMLPPEGAAPSPSAASTTPGPQATPTDRFTSAELEKLLAPISLYPDALLAQVLPASAYPLQLVQAHRWLDKNKAAVEKGDFSDISSQKWDPAVKALVRFPAVIKKLTDDLDWTVDLGDAIVNQPQDVANAIQVLRVKAQKTGSLKSTKEQRVVTTKQGERDVIAIESSDPSVVYVPVYDSEEVYDPTAGALLAFGSAIAIGSIWAGDYWDWNSGAIYPPVWPGYPAWRPPYPGWTPGRPPYPDIGGPGGPGGIGGIGGIGGPGKPGGPGGIGGPGVAGRPGGIGGIDTGSNLKPWRPDAGYKPGMGSKPGIGGKPNGPRARPSQPIALGGPNGAGMARPEGGAGAGLGADAAIGAGAALGAGAAIGAGANRPATRPAARPNAKPVGKPAVKAGAKATAKRPAAKKPAAKASRPAPKGGASRSAAKSRGPNRSAMGGIPMGGANNVFAMRGAVSRMNMGPPGGFSGGGRGGFGGGVGGGGRGGGGRGGGGGRRSDVNLKDHIRLIGHMDNGLGFYRFTYKGGDTAYVGVIAQEVRTVMPDAVVRDRDGYLRVHYDKLGIAFQSYKQWIASGGRVPSGAKKRTYPTM